METENEELKSHIEVMNQQVQDLFDKEKSLQDLITNVREKEFDIERTSQNLASERDQLNERLTSLQARS